MAEGKKKVIWYTNWGETFMKLSDEEAGKLIKHFSAFVLDHNPESPDRLTELLFDPMQDALERDLEKYKRIVERNQKNGKKGGAPKKAKPSQKNQEKPIGLSGNPNKPDTVIVIDIDTDSDTILKRDQIQHLLINSKQWQESVFRNLKANQINVTIDQIRKYIKLFCDKLEAEDDLDKDIKNQKSHFSRWIKIELKNQTKEPKKSRNEKILDSNSQTARELGLDQ